MSPDQEKFDRILAKIMKMIYAPGAAEKLIKLVAKNQDPVAGMLQATEAIVSKVRSSAKKAGSPVPVDMAPDLTLAVISQIAELVKEAGVAEISEEQQSKVLEMFMARYLKESVKSGLFKKEQVAEIAQTNARTQGRPGRQAAKQGGLLS